MRKRRAKIFKNGLIVILIAVFVCTPVFSVSANLKHKAEKAKRKKGEYKKKAEKMEEEAESLAERVSGMEEQIKQLNKEMKRTKKKIKKINKSIVRTKKEIKEKEKELEKKKEILDISLRYLYESGDYSHLDIFLSSDSFTEALDRNEYLQAAEKKIKDTVDKVKAMRDELEEKRSSLEEDKENIKGLRKQLKISKKEIKKEKERKEKLLKETCGKEEKYRKLMAEKRAEYRSLMRRVQNLDRTNKGKHYNGDNYKEDEKKNKDKKNEDKDKEKKDKEKERKKKKNQRPFQWPMKIISLKDQLAQKYGCTSFAKCGNPNGPYGGAPHNGIDLVSIPDRKGFIDLRIRSVMKGKVIMTAPERLSGGWGNAVAIAHPNGLFTLYGHLSKIIVKEGQRVDKGQLIGFEGYTGNVRPKGAAGRHLHFGVYMEITIYKTSWYYGPGYNFEWTLNPMDFLSKKE